MKQATVTETAPSLSFLLQKRRTWFIFGAFFVLTLPLVWTVSHFGPSHPISLSVIALHTCIFEMTHFSITWTVYLRSDNLRFFFSSNLNKFLYLILPLLALFFYTLSNLLHSIFGSGTTVAMIFAGVRALDFLHVGRQSFGVLQLFKVEATEEFPFKTRHLENVLFVGLALFQTKRALYESSFPPNTNWIFSGILVAITILILALYLKAAVSSRQKAVFIRSACYLILQATAAALAVYQIAFYSFALAIHNIEYHILIAPRIFHSPLKDQRHPDKILIFFRKFPVLFYTLLLICGTLLFAITQPGVFYELLGGTLVAPSQLVSLFNGIFLAHYVVEAMIWKFQSPHWGPEIRPLYI